MTYAEIKITICTDRPYEDFTVKQHDAMNKIVEQIEDIVQIQFRHSIRGLNITMPKFSVEIDSCLLVVHNVPQDRPRILDISRILLGSKRLLQILRKYSHI